ncbi:MAG TPA: hypothetical protein VEV15_03840 [Flavisolibacter sp.]|nr:hypothetical protein [Flavisolibacter sp.]
MNQTLKKVKDISGRCCVTILFNTHRTLPDNEKDPLVLKNLIKEATSRLTNECDPQAAPVITEKLNALAATIDHRQNLESLVLFVNEQVAEYERLPVAVEDRVVIGHTFATRDVIRALYKDKEYYVLVLSRDKARLVEAFNDRVVKEVEDSFPVENTFLHPRQSAEAAVANRQTNLQQEFFNIVDKQLLEVIKQNPWPVLICTEESNYHQYLKVADRKEIIMGHLNGNRMEEKAHHIIEAAWPVVLQIRQDNIRARTQELSAAENTGKLVTDFNDIWRAVNQGRGQTLFVQQGYFQPARLVNDTIELVPAEQTDRTGVIDDIIDDIIDINLQYGGDCVFLSGDELKNYQGLVLTTRY